MEITRYETWILRLPFVRESSDKRNEHHELVGVTLYSQSGESGLGFTWCSEQAAGSTIKTLLDEFLLPKVIGRSAMHTEAIWQDLTTLTHRMGYGVTSFAIAAIDIALWDLRSRSNGQSLAQELGQVSEVVPAYGSGRGAPTLDIKELIRQSAAYVNDGFDAVKVRIGLSPEDDVRRVSALRKALGDDVKIMCDANERLSVTSALWVGQRLSEFDIFWLEEPVSSDNVAAHARLSAALPMPIAGGEHLCSSPEFLSYTSANALDVLQPNACMMGGITPTLRVGTQAGLNGLDFAPHAFSEIHIHIAAALPNTTYLEYFPWLDAFVEEPLKAHNGQLVVPEGPGHGISFSKTTWDEYRIG